MKSIKKTKFEKYLYDHYCNDNENHTHTRIKNADLKITGGTFKFDENAYREFEKMYIKHVFVDNKFEYITEAINKESGPIAIDFDFRYDKDIEERKHEDGHIIDMVHLYVEHLKKMLVFDSSKEIEFPVYIFEKNDVNMLENVTKDGIHMIIGINMPRALQIMMRERIISELPSIWNDLPLVNSWTDVIDESIVRGSTNWQLYGSRKPGNQAYMLSKYISITLHNDDIKYNDVGLKNFVLEDNFSKLSVRYTGYDSFSMQPEFQEEFDKMKENMSRKKPITNGRKMNIVKKMSGKIDYTSIKSAEDLDEAIECIFEELEDVNYEIKESHQFTMCLNEEFYDPYDKWVRVGWALKNTSEKLFLTWVKFSSKSEKFDFENIDDLYDMWLCFNSKNKEGLTKRSIMYWAKNCDIGEYQKVREETIDFYVEKTINDGTEFDLAEVLYNMYKDRFICISIKNNIWYEFTNNRWFESDSGNALRLVISKQLYDIYMKKLEETSDFMNKLDPSSDKWTSTQKRISKISLLCPKLKATNFKNNIMREARELFYDKDSIFMNTLDSKNHLLCFNNGVVDFDQKCFRKGQPDDNISLCTNIDYVKLNDKKHKKAIGEINDFMCKLFPVEQLRNYMWEHLASCLIGGNRDQTFNIYNGCGSNGKSKLVELMSSCMGEYKASVPITLITQKRISIGNSSSEIAQLVGKRYAVMQEPSKGDRINEGIMKEITGGDPIQGRALYRETITFVPQFKLVVCTNNLFAVESNDDGTWRRIRICDFMSKFCVNPEKDDRAKPYQYEIDKDLDLKLKTWAPIFMSMLVEKAYETNGLVNNCPIVMSSSTSYRNNQDCFSEFVSDKIKPSPGDKVKETELKHEFKEWYNLRYNSNVPKGKELFDYITKLYGKKIKGKWKDISIVYDNDDDFDDDEED